ncbi:hypothetical protein [Sinobacterium norvegicum]
MPYALEGSAIDGVIESAKMVLSLGLVGSLGHKNYSVEDSG